jgi:hypothetical protein
MMCCGEVTHIKLLALSIQWLTNERSHYRPSATCASPHRQNALAVRYQHPKQYTMAEYRMQR